ncbi:sigma factor-like helix-turn-helix DNA-binding protein [Actinoplanes sp. CA-252034]|uniref:sigma factor-like helix-turn-helix DNA-binding protein n=1 Tax=Actinoplanes sp. CA-252034 TaxID=3239906 RepID=UPI003D998C34
MTSATFPTGRALPRTEREAVALCLWSGVFYAEAAAFLGVTESSVRSRAGRARARLNPPAHRTRRTEEPGLPHQGNREAARALPGVGGATALGHSRFSLQSRPIQPPVTAASASGHGRISLRSRPIQPPVAAGSASGHGRFSLRAAGSI